jgi:hypothetical protein
MEDMLDRENLIYQTLEENSESLQKPNYLNGRESLQKLWLERGQMLKILLCHAKTMTFYSVCYVREKK